MRGEWRVVKGFVHEGAARHLTTHHSTTLQNLMTAQASVTKKRNLGFGGRYGMRVVAGNTPEPALTLLETAADVHLSHVTDEPQPVLKLGPLHDVGIEQGEGKART